VTIPAVLEARIDLHTHVLPAVDDGARTMEEALEMLRMASADGTRTIVATPHATQVTTESLRAGMERLQAAAQDIDVAILAGSEVRFSANLADDFHAGKLVTIADSGYLLVEFPFSQWTPLVHTSLYALQLAGAIPIVAHAERYPSVQEDPSILVELARMGVPIQVNAGSFMGDEGEETRRTAELLLRAGLVHILASDGHREDKRKPVLRDAFNRIVQLAGDGCVRQLQQNAERVIGGRSLNIPDPDVSALRPRSRLRGLFSRVRSA
jgi:protein-tyrosine phosphatase